MKQNVSIEAAQNLILENIYHLPWEKVSIMQAAGRIMADKVVADQDLPSTPQSAVDGFALGDTINSRFSLVSPVQPGGLFPVALSYGQAAAVYTGAYLPPGTLSVIMHEKVLLNGDMISVIEDINPGNNIKNAGEDFKQGETLVNPNTVLTAGHIGLLAAFGHHEVSVYKCPRLALLGLSENVIPCSQTPQPDQTRDSNSPLLTAFIKHAGGSVAEYKLALEIGENKLMDCLESLRLCTDLIILMGGTYAESQSEAQMLLESAGARIVYWGTDIQPGSHNGFALYQGIPVFALSGNPAACAVGFNLFVLPALRYMQGIPPTLKKVKARCNNNFNKTARSHRLVRARISFSNQGWDVTVLPGQKPSMLKSLIDCNALIEMPAGHPPLESGQEVNVIILEADERLLNPIQEKN